MSPRADDVRWERATVGDVVAASVLLALLAPFAYRTTVALAAGGHGVALAVALLLGVLTADFLTGCLHWLADTFFAEDTPLIGRAVIEPFREHHRDPLAMTRRSFLRVSTWRGSRLPAMWTLPAPSLPSRMRASPRWWRTITIRAWPAAS